MTLDESLSVSPYAVFVFVVIARPSRAVCGGSP